MFERSKRLATILRVFARYRLLALLPPDYQNLGSLHSSPVVRPVAPMLSAVSGCVWL